MECPPFQVEDQTDEDFFDKLVADDDDFRVTEFAPSFAEGEESDEVKAFSNLSIGEADTVLEDSGGEGGVTDKEEMHSDVAVAPVSDVSEDILVTEESDSRISSNLLTFDNGIESSDAAAGVDVALNSITSKSSGGLGITSVKEVQWSLFNSDPTQHSGNGFGSYSDFFTELVDNSADPFQKAGDYSTADSNTTSSIPENTVAKLTSFSSVQHHEDQAYGESTLEQTSDGQDLNGSQNWENLYPGWRYDPNTGEWRQLDGSDAIETQGILGSNVQSIDNGFVLDQKSEVSYLQETAQSVRGTIAEGCTTSYNSNWNQVSQGSTEYPPHMVFDPQYPGWYYDTIAQEWRLLESYDPAIQSTTVAHDQQNQNENALTGGSFPADGHSLYNEHGKIKEYGSQGLGYQDQGGDWTVSTSNYTQQNTNIWQPGTIIKSDSGTSFAENQQLGNLYGSRDLVNNYADQLMGFQSMETVSLYKQTNHSYESSNGVTGYQSFLPAEKFSQQLNQPNMEQSQQMHFSHDYSGSQNSGNFSQQPFQAGAQFSYAPNEKRSSAGRPPHALVAFGFGGKLIVMKDGSAFGTNSVYGSQESGGGSISILKLMEVVMDRTEAASDYFFTLCQQSFPGPLVGGNIGSKELNRWIDERIANCGSPNMDYRKGEYLKLLLSLLKIACQHYGKLRSPFGTDAALKESDCPELAVAKLFASAKRNHTQLSEYGALTHCLHNLPSEGQIQATAIEVQNLLVSGRTKEALQCAQEGQLWGPALVLAAHLGDQLYVDTVMQMAHRQLVAGSPLRTLCLLIAGKPADVFSTGSTTMSGIPAAINISQQSTQIGANGMLDDWEENLAIITGNRTKGDELVLIYLGDCLLKERGEITAAHICYLVAEANFESYSNSARMCLIGADHWKFPRTYASPEAIQRTELYEYSMVLGNSQSILLPFQPYKLLYAHMLAEVGKISDSLKYCQAILKSLKTGRAPELETWKQLVSSLEERIRTHQQGGYGTNLAPAKLVGKLLPFIDRSIHRMIGAPPSPVPSISQSSVQNHEHDHLLGPRVANSQSTMTMSSLMPSASMEPISDWSDDITMPNRSISEPDFGRSPRQDRINPSKDAASSNAQVKASVSGGSSRFGLFGSQIFQKTMGWVSRSRPDRQAKLGEKNKFYYDEKLKRWVEEGAEPPAEEAALPPPPTAAFQNGTSDYNIKTALRSESLPANEGPEIKSPAYSDRSSGIPPIPPSSNQFSARGRMGVRSRYVDTFNKGGGTPTNLFQSPSVPAAKPGSGANAKFFIPTAAPSGEQTVDATKESTQKINASNEDSATSVMDSSFPSLSSSSSLPMQRFPSMNDIAPIGNKGMGVMGNGNSSFSSHSRRTASWGGSMTEMVVPKTTEIKSLGKTLRMAPPSFIPTDLSSTHPQMNFSSTHQQMNGRRLGDELHEVEL